MTDQILEDFMARFGETEGYEDTPVWKPANQGMKASGVNGQSGLGLSDDLLKKMSKSFMGETGTSTASVKGAEGIEGAGNVDMAKMGGMAAMGGMGITGNVAKPAAQAGAKMGGGMNMSNMAGQIGMLGDTLGASNQFAERYNYDPKMKQEYLQGEAMKDTIAQFTGPWGMAARGVEKAGKAIGTAVGGETGGDIASGIFDPFSGQKETFQNDDAKDSEKAISLLLPIASGMMAGKARNRTKGRLQAEKFKKETTLEKMKLDKEYDISEGLESIKSLKGLREKQIGLI